MYRTAGPNGSSSNTCTLTFTAASDASLTRPTLIQIQGVATSIAIGELAVNSALPTLSVSGTPLQLPATPSASGSMILTNNSVDKPAINVQASLGTSLSGLVYPSYPGGGTACPTIPHGGTCTITFTPYAYSVSPLQTVSFSGDNTETSTGQISLGSYLLYVTNLSTSSPINASNLDSYGYITGSSFTIVSNQQNYLYGIAMNNPTTTGYYFTNFNGSDGTKQTVYSCPVNEATGSFSGCKSISISISSYLGGIAYNSVSNNVLYLSTGNSPAIGTGSLATCTLSDSGVIGACTYATYTGVYNSNGVGFNETGSSLLVSNAGTGNQYGGGFCTPGKDATVTQYHTNKTTGAIHSSPKATMSITNGIVPGGIAVNTLGTYAYVTINCSNSTYGVYSCPLSGGLLPPDTESCTMNTLSGCSFTQAMGIALNGSNDIAYISVVPADPGSSSAYICQCTINSNNGHLNDCQPSNAGTYEPYGVALYPTP